MLIVNSVVLLAFSLPSGESGSLLLDSAAAALLDDQVLVLEVRECSAELVVLVSDQKVRRAGHEAAARLAQLTFPAEQFLEVESAYGVPLALYGAPDCSAWGLRVVVVLDERGRPALRG